MVRVKNDGRASNPVFTAAKIIAITLLLTLFYLWSRLEVISLGYDIARANKEQAEFVNENKRLKLEILSLKSPQRIEALASERLGLVYPKGGAIDNSKEISKSPHQRFGVGVNLLNGTL